MLVERESKLLKGAIGHITRKDLSAMRPLTPLFLTLALLLCSCRTSLPPSSSPASQEADQGSYRIGVRVPTKLDTTMAPTRDTPTQAEIIIE